MESNISLMVIEPDYHPEVLRSTVRLAIDTKSVNISVITTKSIWEKAFNKTPGEINLILAESNHIFDFLKRNIEYINQYDIVLFNTLSTQYYIFLKLNFKGPKLILRIHNCRSTFKPFKNLYRPNSIYLLYKFFSHIIRIEIYMLAILYRNKALRKFDFYLFPTDEIATYAKNHLGVCEKRIIYPSIPLVFFEKSEIRSKVNFINKLVAIPGSFNLKRRDYYTLYKALISLPTQETTVDFHFLGPIQGGAALTLKNKLKALKRNDIRLHFYKDFIPDDVFKRLIYQAEFLLLPVRSKVRCRIFLEHYGITKVSGSINDAIRFGIPAILPDFYPIPPNLNEAFITYKNGIDLSIKLDHLLNSDLPQNNFLFKNYSRDRFTEYFFKTLLRIKNY